MVAELSALQQIVNTMTGLNGLPAVIVECAVTTIYTCTETLLTINAPTG
jgi:ABC-type proline/glycine betaine transport system permease subunit